MIILPQTCCKYDKWKKVVDLGNSCNLKKDFTTVEFCILYLFLMAFWIKWWCYLQQESVVDIASFQFDI